MHDVRLVEIFHVLVHSRVGFLDGALGVRPRHRAKLERGFHAGRVGKLKTKINMNLRLMNNSISPRNFGFWDLAFKDGPMGQKISNYQILRFFLLLFLTRESSSPLKSYHSSLVIMKAAEISVVTK